MHMRSYAILLGSAIYLTAAAVGCNDSPSSDAQEARAPDNTNTAIGPARVDQPRNGSVEVEEKALHATLHDADIELSIPVRGVRSGQGSVIAELIRVDGSKVLASAELDYSLDKDEAQTLEARFKLPDDVKEQADRATYSVRVRDDKGNLRVTRSLMYVLTPYELQFEGPAALRVERQGSYRVRAQAMPSREPIIDQAVSIAVVHDGEVAETLHGTTDESGSAIFSIDVDKPGAYSLAVADAAETLSGQINVRESDQKILLTTDKPIYQPGQTMHLRAMALQSPDNKPLAASKLLFEVSDGKGNKVFKKTRKTDDYGIASVDFKLASLVNMGSYKLQVSGAIKAEKTVEVSRYVLPKFDVKVATDRSWYQAGGELRGTVDARYFFGKLVNGADAVVEALTLDVGSQVFQRVMGKTDEQGRFAFSIKLPDVLAGLPIQNGNALVTLRTSITDTAGQLVQKDTPVTVADGAIQLSLVPEATQVVPGIENRFHLFATDPLGAPITKAKVELSGATTLSAETDDFGHAELRWKVANQQQLVQVDVSSHEGMKAHREFSFAAQSGQEHVLVRTDKSLYNLGETVKVQVIGTRSETRAYLDWLNDGQAVDMRTLELKDGVASFEVTLDTGLVGENRIEAYVVDDAGNSVRAGRTIVVQQDGALKVELSKDKSEYRPGEPAKLTFSVTDQAGKPAPSALGVQIVDEAVFGLIDARPGLLRTFFELEDSFAMPQYEIHAPQVSFEKLLFEDAAADDAQRRQSAQAQAEAQLSALRNQRMMGLALGSWKQTLEHMDGRLTQFYTEDRKRLIDALKPAVADALAKLEMLGCKPEEYYCASQSTEFFTLFQRAIDEKFSLYDFWGTRYASGPASYDALTFTSAGPDELRGTEDDKSTTVSLRELGVTAVRGFTTQASLPAFPAAGAAGAGASVAAGAAPATATAAGHVPEAGDANTAQDSASPRVRSEFPETLYVNPALITDANGKADVSLDMADSITSWRVSTLANAKGGALGGGQAAIKVFQDFFVDVAFPAELTRGDEVEFPVVVYNYLKSEQTVRLELESASWFTALGSTSTSLTLAAGSVQSVKIPVRIEKVGAQTLTVRAFGTNASDAVARSVRVVPDGTQIPSAQSGSLAQGSKSLTVNVASDAIAGSPQLYLDVYPGFTSQVVQGLDSMLQVPNGCFEQTTSTTWPNVLITRYLAQTKQNTPEIQLKAESLISAGYQRLLTYEHPSGGFSWFGAQGGAQPDLSVTSFGLMEFADMAKVSEVDPDMIARTQQWLASKQEADGSFTGGQTEFFSFQTSQLRSTAFTAWAFAESDYKGDALDRALNFVRSKLEASTDDTYTLALAANAFAAAAPNDDALTKLLDKLEEAKIQEGAKIHWASGTDQTNFYGSGLDSDVSTTALIAQALVRAGTHSATANGAIQYLVGSKDTNGNFGSTQATIWSLKTLMLAAEHGSEGAVGQLNVLVDGQSWSSVSLKKNEADLNTRVDMSSLATTGNHTVELDFMGSGQVSYNLVSAYHVPWSSSSSSSSSSTSSPTNAGPLAISVSYDRTSLAVDETVQANLEIRNLTRRPQSMLLVTVGLPPGFELQTEDLDDYVAKQRISRYERTAKQLILYITTLEANTTLPLAYHLKATMPVRAADGGSQVALYYQPDQRAVGSSTLLVATAN